MAAKYSLGTSTSMDITSFRYRCSEMWLIITKKKKKKSMKKDCLVENARPVHNISSWHCWVWGGYDTGKLTSLCKYFLCLSSLPNSQKENRASLPELERINIRIEPTCELAYCPNRLILNTMHGINYKACLGSQYEI